jgi:squalene-associated FAD-dependent desaturase
VAASCVAVVGGGLAGLSAAMKLKNAGWHVELFERSRLLGGRATSFELDGRVVDNGQHVYLACCTEFVRFVDRAGMADALHLQDRFEVVVYGKNGVRSGLRAADLPAPFHLLASFFGYKHLSFSGKLQISRALGSLALNPSSATEDISFAQWLSRHGQNSETIRSFWEPFLVPALNAPLDRMNAADAAFVISTAFLKDRGAARFGYSKVPLANIMDAAAAQLDKVHRSTAVFSMEADSHNIVLHASDDELRFDAAVLAVGPRALARLLDDPPAFGVPPLNVYEPFAIMDVHLWYEGAPLQFDFAAILDSPVQWVFQKAPGYLCCSISAADELVAKPTSEMVEYAWREVQAALPLAGTRLERGAATRNPEGTYLAAPGALRSGPRTALPNLTIAGAWTATGWPDTMESAVRSGLAAAKSLDEQMRNELTRRPRGADEEREHLGAMRSMGAPS